MVLSWWIEALFCAVYGVVYYCAAGTQIENSCKKCSSLSFSSGLEN